MKTRIFIKYKKIFIKYLSNFCLKFFEVLGAQHSDQESSICCRNIVSEIEELNTSGNRYQCIKLPHQTKLLKILRSTGF